MFWINKFYTLLTYGKYHLKLLDKITGTLNKYLLYREKAFFRVTMELPERKRVAHNLQQNFRDSRNLM